MYPTIKHIDDVLPHIENRSDIIVINKTDYFVVDYVYNADDTFDNEIRRECRGLKFDKNGDIIARPLHKFFNLNERLETQNSVLDFGKPHRVLDKLDGTMVHGCILNGELVLMTRKGVTEHALRAFELLTEGQKKHLKICCYRGYTPILEYIGPENQIVLFYEEPKLIWLAVRNIITGEYNRDYDTGFFEYPYEYDYHDVQTLVERTRDLKDKEGVVVVWDDGFRIKIKADEYVEKHKHTVGVSREIDYLHAIFDDTIDDILPLKSGPFRERLDKYVYNVNNVINFWCQTVDNIVSNGRLLDQKTFAIEHMRGYQQVIKNICFDLRRNGGNIYETVVKHFKNFLKQQKDLDENRYLIGVKLDV